MLLELKWYYSCLTHVTDSEIICADSPQEIYGLSHIQQVSNLKFYSRNYVIISH